MVKKLSNRLFIKIVGVVFLFAPLVVFAQLDSAPTPRQQIKQDREVLRTKTGDKLRAMQSDFQMKRDELKGEVKGLVPKEAKERFEEFRKEIRDKREEIRIEIKNEREEFHKKADERREKLKKNIGEERARRIEEYFTRMMNRMDAAVDRLDTLADRIESRLNKIRDAGKDITEPQAALDTARVAIAAVHTAISDAKTKFAELSKNNTPKEQFSAIKEIVNVVKTKSKEAHAALVEVINSIKRGRLDVEATTTPKTQ